MRHPSVDEFDNKLLSKKTCLKSMRKKMSMVRVEQPYSLWFDTYPKLKSLIWSGFFGTL
jgi:hypothetical protein